MKLILSEFWEFMKNFCKRILAVISYPQYLLASLELILVIFVFSVIDNKTVFKYLMVISWGFLLLLTLYHHRNLSCGSVNKQMKGNKTKGTVVTILNQNEWDEWSARAEARAKARHSFMIYLLTRLFFTLEFYTSIYNHFIRDFFYFSILILTVCHIMVYSKKISPFIFFPLFLGLSVFVLEIRTDKAVINWTLLLLLFGTTIGANFFDKNLVKNRISDKILEENLILRKISLYIGLVFLYIGVYISDKIIDSTIYFTYTSRLFPGSNFFPDITTKIFILSLIFVNYLTTHKIISYLILRICYRNNKPKISSDLMQVKLEKGEWNEKWKVKDVKLQDSEISKLEIISIDTYQIRGGNKDTYYVSQSSEILEKIEGRSKYQGYLILGDISRDKITVPLVIVTLLILPAISILDGRVKVDNGIYKIFGKSDKTDISDTVEISGDTIIYNGKAEHFDIRRQSFSMGKIKKKDSDNITINFYNSGKEVRYEKSGYSGSW